MWNDEAPEHEMSILAVPPAFVASERSRVASEGSGSVREFQFAHEADLLADPDKWLLEDNALQIEQEEIALGWRGFTEHGVTCSSGCYRPIPTRDSDLEEVDDSSEGQQSLSRYQAWRARVKVTLEDPSSSFAGHVSEYFLIFSIFTSVSCAIAETVPGVGWHSFFLVTELTFTIIFSVEIALRFWTFDSMRSYFADWFNIIDICSTLPGYSEILLPILKSSSSEERQAEHVTASMRTLRLAQLVKTIRLLRVLRLAKVMRRSESLVVVVKSIWGSLRGLGVLVAFVVLGIVISATICFFFEAGVENTEFESIPASMWWAAATVMAVGYGDIVPISVAGKITASVTMLVGTVITAVCVAVITSSFTELYARNLYMARARNLQAKIQGLRARESGANETSPQRRDSVAAAHASLWNTAKSEGLLSVFRSQSKSRWGVSPLAAGAPLLNAQGDMNVAEFVNQLDEMTDNLMVGIENLISSEEPFVQVAESERRCARMTLDHLRKSSKLWFEQVRGLSEELLTARAEELTMLTQLTSPALSPRSPARRRTNATEPSLSPRSSRRANSSRRRSDAQPSADTDS